MFVVIPSIISIYFTFIYHAVIVKHNDFTLLYRKLRHNSTTSQQNDMDLHNNSQLQSINTEVLLLVVHARVADKIMAQTCKRRIDRH